MSPAATTLNDRGGGSVDVVDDEVVDDEVVDDAVVDVVVELPVVVGPAVGGGALVDVVSVDVDVRAAVVAVDADVGVDAAAGSAVRASFPAHEASSTVATIHPAHRSMPRSSHPREDHAVIRDAHTGDVPAITAIYNETIATTTGAWTEEPDSLEYRVEWFERQRARGNAVLVAEEDDDVVGFASYGEFRDNTKWPGYRFTVEHSIHVTESHWGRGIGRALMSELRGRAAAAGLRVMIGAVDGENGASIEFHRRIGFREVGRLPGIGEKFGRRLDLVLMQADLAPIGGGDPACWLDRVCDACGGVIEGVPHVCRSATPR